MRLRPKRIILGNGIDLVHYPSPSNPFVAFRGNLWTGAVSEEKRGVTEFTANLLLSGTKKLKSAQLSETIERLGATLNFRNSDEAMLFSGRCPRASAHKVFGILVDVLSNPSFPKTEIERVRGEIIDHIRVDMDNTERRAIRELLGSIFPDHLYGRDPRGDIDDVRKVGRSDIVSFHKAHYGPKGMIVSISGDIDTKFVETKIAPTLSRFEGESERPVLEPPVGAKGKVKVVPMPHKSQVDIAIGLPAIPRVHKDFHALSLANLLFGVMGLYGRLGRNIRDEQGLAYYCFSWLDARVAGGDWGVIAGVNPNNLQKAVAGIIGEIDRLHDEPLTKQEISDGKDNQVGGLKVVLERNADMASEIHRMEYYGLGLNYLERYAGKIKGLTTAQIRRAARKYIRAEDCSIAVAGPVPKSIERSLRRR